MTLTSSVDIQHAITPVAQQTNMTCWSAATAMLTGSNRTVWTLQAQTDSSGGLGTDAHNIQQYAREQGLRLFYPQTWAVEGLVDLLRRGPVAMMGIMPGLHAVVISGIATDGNPANTILTIYDPWPPGLIGHPPVRINYQALVTRFPVATMYMLQK